MAMMRRGKPPTRPEVRVRTNEQIRVHQVRLIDAEGVQVGVLDVASALQMAKEAELDLVEVAPEATPPVCRIMDYGKFVYEKRKKTKKSVAHTSVLKEIKIRPKISVHDFDFKSKHVERFLKQGDKVKVTLMFRGREIEYAQESIQLLNKMAKAHEKYCQIEKVPALEGRNMYMILAPISKK